jgi:hypothetical protein
MSLGVSLRSRSLKARQRIALQLAQEKAECERKMIEANREAVEDFIVNVFQSEANEVAEQGGSYILYDTRKYSWTHEFLTTLEVLAKDYDLQVQLQTESTGNGMMDDVWTVVRVSW